MNNGSQYDSRSLKASAFCLRSVSGEDSRSPSPDRGRSKKSSSPPPKKKRRAIASDDDDDDDEDEDLVTDIYTNDSHRFKLTFHGLSTNRTDVP